MTVTRLQHDTQSYYNKNKTNLKYGEYIYNNGMLQIGCQNSSLLIKYVQIQGKKIIFPGEAVGLARVEQVGTSANRSRVIRRWNEIKPGYLAEEKMQFGGSSYLRFLMNTKDISFMPAFFMNPYSEDWKYSERIEVKAAIQLGDHSV